LCPVPGILAGAAIHRGVHIKGDQVYDIGQGAEMIAVIQDCIAQFAILLTGAVLFGLIAAAVDLLFDAF
jgi:hypothetical protein